MPSGVDAHDLAARPGAGVDGAVGRQGQAEHLAVLGGVQDRRLAVGRHLVDLALVAGGDDQVAVAVLDDVPDVGGVEAGQRLELPRTGAGPPRC